MKVDLSIIILSFNTKDLTRKAILTLLKNLRLNKNFTSEVIVFDNASGDGSPAMLEELKNKNKEVKVIISNKNLGFAKGNNEALKIAKGRYILYFNSDVLVQDINFKDLLSYMDKNKVIGGLTVKVVLSDGNIDPASHRGFPNLSNSIFYFIGLEKLTQNVPLLNKIFGGYHLKARDLTTIHDIDSPTGAFFLSRSDILKKLGGFDEKFFFYGEDLDLAFRIKKLGYKIIYYPIYTVLHLKHASSGDDSKKKKTKNMTRYHFYDSMIIFYQKHYQNNNSKLVNEAIYFLLNRMKNKYAQDRD